MLKIKLDITNFFAWAARQYFIVQKNLEQDARNSEIQIKYKIMSSHEEYVQTGKLLIQSRQGSAYLNMTPEEVYEDKFLMSHLHPMDVSLITKLFLDTKNTNNDFQRYQILKQEFSGKEGRVTYTIYDPQNESTLKVDGDELLESQEILKRLSGIDGMSLGFDMGVKHIKSLSSKFQ